MRRILFSFIALISSPAAADSLQPLKLNAVYQFEFATITFGQVGLAITQDASQYEAVSDITSTGVARVFVKHESHSESKGSGKNYVYPDVVYDSQYATRGKKKAAHLEWEGGTLEKEELQPVETGKRPAISEDLKNAALDPLHFGMAMRQQLFEAKASGKQAYTLNVFDGRRLTQADFVVKGATKVRYKGKDVTAFRVDVTRRLIAGFTESEIKEAEGKKDPPLHIYFSQDERFIPLVLDVPLFFGKMRAVLARECAMGENCLIPAKQ